MVFLDFDRTLCSTKSGGSPLIGKHSVDPELLSVAALYPTHLVTRNSHAEQIGVFLEARGVLLAGLHVARKGKSKAEVLERVLSEASPGATAVFADDSIAEVNPNVFFT